MEVVFSTEIHDRSHRSHFLEICVGDATEAHSPSEVDVLAISCFENCYAPTRGTMVEGLWNRGIKVADVARRKALDERARWQCWMSEVIPSGVLIGRALLLIPPGHRGAEAIDGDDSDLRFLSESCDIFSFWRSKKIEDSR